MGHKITELEDHGGHVESLEDRDLEGDCGKQIVSQIEHVRATA